MADSKNVLTASDAAFDSEVLAGSQLVLVDFWAEWCGPCKQLGPVIAELADEFVGKMKTYKLNVDENPVVPARFQIRGIPTVLFFKNQELVDQLVGNQPKTKLQAMIQQHL